MTNADVLKQTEYKPGDIVLLGSHETEGEPGHIRSHRNTDGTYIVDVCETYLRVHESTILGRVLTIEEKYKNLSKHAKEMLEGLSKSAARNTELYEENKRLREMVSHLQFALNRAEKNEHVVYISV